MRHVVFFLLIVSTLQQANGQTVKLDTVLGKRILHEQNAWLKEHGGKPDYLTFWNTAVAYKYLGAPADSIYTNLFKSMQSGPDEFLEAVDAAIQLSQDSIENVAFFKILGSKFTSLIQEAQILKIQKPNIPGKVSPVLNQRVVNQLEKLLDKDQKYRGQPTFLKDKIAQQKQWELDSLNALELELLYKEYGYPGKSITGDNEYQNYFAIIVHHLQSPSGKYRHWFPRIEKAYLQKELSTSIFKLMLDRLHFFDTGKQYFGTQIGEPLEDDEKTNEIKLKYGFY